MEEVDKKSQTVEFEADIWSLLEDDINAVIEDREIDDSDDEAREDVAEYETEVGSLIAQNSVQSCNLNLLVSLFTHLPSSTDDKFYSPIIRFHVLHSLQNGQWLPGRRITQVFAALLFCGREITMALMRDQVNMRYSR